MRFGLLILAIGLIAQPSFASIASTASEMAQQFAARRGQIVSGLERLPDVSPSTQTTGVLGALVMQSALYRFSTGYGDECVISSRYFENSQTGPEGRLSLGLHCENGGRVVANYYQKVR